jgi:hypothetical protein
VREIFKTQEAKKARRSSKRGRKRLREIKQRREGRGTERKIAE